MLQHRIARQDRQAFLATGRARTKATIGPRDGNFVRCGHAQRVGQHMRSGAPSPAIERPHFLHTHDIDVERTQLLFREGESLGERRFGTPEVQRDDSQSLAHTCTVARFSP